MPFVTSLSTAQQNDARAGGYSARQYLLICPNTVVFQAQVNQSVFASSFASVTFDNVTTGAASDIRDGFTVYIGDTTDIRQASFVGRARADNSGVVASSTVLNINWTSATIGNDQYITVVKDIRPVFRLPYPRTDGTDIQFKDFALEYGNGLRPIIQDLQTVYVARRDSNGNADVVLAPDALAINQGASISSWSWDPDGGAFQAGNASSQDVTLRYTAAGHYMPRVTVTDSNGVTNWFSPHVFVVNQDYSGGNIVNLGVQGASVTADLTEGYNAQISAFAGVDELPDYTFCAIWNPSPRTAPTSDIAFCGRFRSETTTEEKRDANTRLQNTDFVLEGIGTILGRMKSLNFTFRNVATQSRWDEIKQLTPWRAIAYYLTEHTTVINTHSLAFDDETTTYIFDRVSVSDSSVLDSLQIILRSYTSGLEFCQSGEIRAAYVAWLRPAASRAALGTVANFTRSDMQIDAQGGQLYSVRRDYVRPVGRVVLNGAYYTEATDTYQPIEAVTPAIAPDEGPENQSVNSQILTANSTLPAAFNELGQRAADFFAAAQPQTTLEVTLPDGYWYLQPFHGKWATWTVTTGRGVSYTTDDRWTLQSLTTDFDIVLGRRVLRARFRLETTGAGFQVATRIPAGEEEESVPPIPPPPYDTLPPLDDGFADPDNPLPEDEQPYEPPLDDGAKTPGQRQHDQRQASSKYAMAWSDNNVYEVTNFGITNQPTFTGVTPTNASGSMDFVDAKFDVFSTSGKAWALANDGTDSEWFRTEALGSLKWVKVEQTGVFELIRQAGEADKVYAYGPDTTSDPQVEFDFENDGQQGWFVPGGSPAPGGTFTPGTGFVASNMTSGTSRRREAWARYVDLQVGDTITAVRVVYDFTAGNVSTLFVVTSNPSSTNSFSLSNGTGQDNTFTLPSSITYTGSPLLDVIMRSSIDNSSPYSFSGDATIYLIELIGTFAGVAGAQTIYSSDGGETFDSPVVVGTGISGGNAGADTLIGDDKIFAAQDGKLREATAGGAYSDTTGAGTATPICVVAYGETTDKFLYATSTALFDVDGGTATDITPVDSAVDGVAVGPNCVHMPRGNDTHIVGVFSFAGTRQVAFSSNLGQTWNFNTQVSNTASYVRVKQIEGDYAVAIVDSDSIWYALWDGGSSMTLTEYDAPEVMDGFEFYP